MSAARHCGPQRQQPRPACSAAPLLALTIQAGQLLAFPLAAAESIEEITVTAEHETLPSGAEIACRPQLTGHDQWIDRLQRIVYERVCRSALWFDGFFGDARYDELDISTFGRVALGLEWDDRDGLGSQFRFRARAPLPQFNERLSAFLGRTNQEEFITNRSEGLLGLPSEFREATDEEWLAGFGYSPLRSDRSRLDFDVGMRLNFPAEAFARGTYRTHRFVGDRTLLRFRETGFWQREEGFGATSQFDWERLVGETGLLRFASSVTFAQFIEGVDWNGRLTLFKNLSDRHAMAYQLEMSGETDAPVPLQDYGARLIYRQRFMREWLFLDVRASLTWPKDLPEQARTANPGLSLGFEMLFGKSPSIELR